MKIQSIKSKVQVLTITQLTQLKGGTNTDGQDFIIVEDLDGVI